jgi:hypothetical protein
MKNTRPQISESVEKTVMELKQKFNALNIAGILSGPLSDSITEKVTGNIQQNIQNFIGKTPKSKMVTDQPRKVGNVDTNFYVTAVGKQTVKKGDGVATVAGKLFNLYKKSFDEKKLQMELSRNFEKELHDEDERRHKDLINSIEKTSKPSRRNEPNKKVNVSKSDIKKVQENRGGIVSKVIGAVKDVGTAAVVGGAAIVAGGAVVAGYGLSALLEKGEAKTYDTQYGGGRKEGLEKMTVNEVLKYQHTPGGWNAKSSAIGKYQIMSYTLEAAKKDLRLTGNELFDKNLQDKIYKEYLTGDKRPALKAYLTGKTPDDEKSLDKAQIALAQEFASVPVPFRMQGHHRIVEAGETYYAGDKLNKAGVSIEDTRAKLKQERALRTGKVSEQDAQQMAGGKTTYTKVSDTGNVQSARNLSIAGDSIAYGVSGTSLGKEAKTQATQGLTTRKIIDAVKTKTTNKLGTNSKNEGDITNSDISVISAGTNDWANLTNLSNDLEELRKVVNAKKYIWILPPNTTPSGKNIAGARKIVEAFAAKHNDETVSFDPPPGGDQIHPNPVDLEQKVRQKIKQIQSQTVIQKTETPNSGERLNNKTAENEKLKENTKPVSYVNNSKKTTQMGNKPNIKILNAANKPDYPPFMKVTLS